ncbi:helix-turn-helix domain-containing protein [Moraxella sp. K1630]|uniref:helix-turn-helix domain-containing protein n=1 Tax=Moraxella TaxID=475 RepID=UPI0009F449B5
MVSNAVSVKTVVIIFLYTNTTHIRAKTLKKMAIDMYLEGLGFRSIGRVLNISYGTVYQWVKQ